MRRLYLTALVGLGSVIVASGCASTAWISKTPKADSEYIYVVGRSFDAKTAHAGIELARSDAKARAVEEHFGAKYRFQRDTHEEIDGAQVIDRSRTLSQTVQLEGFEEQELHQDEVDDERFNTAILFRWSRRNVEVEKTRLGAKPTDNEDLAFAPVDTTPRRQPASVSQAEVHRAVQSTFIIGAVAGAAAKTMGEADNSVMDYGLQVEMRLSRYVGLNLTGSFGGKTLNYTNGSLGINRTALGVGLPIFVARVDRASWTPYIEPGLQFLRSGFAFLDPSGATTSDTSKLQLGASAEAGVQIRLSAEGKSGFSIRTQAGMFRPFLNPTGVSPVNAYQGRLLLGWEFFDK